MLTRYLELRPFIETKNAELPPYVLTSRRENQIKKDLKIFETVSNKMQNEKTTMENASILFPGLCSNFSSKYPNFTNYLQLDPNILFSPHFESGTVKAMGGESRNQLEEAEIGVFEESGVCCIIAETTPDLAEYLLQNSHKNS